MGVGASQRLPVARGFSPHLSIMSGSYLHRRACGGGGVGGKMQYLFLSVVSFICMNSHIHNFYLLIISTKKNIYMFRDCADITAAAKKTMHRVRRHKSHLALCAVCSLTTRRRQILQPRAFKLRRHIAAILPPFLLRTSSWVLIISAIGRHRSFNVCKSMCNWDGVGGGGFPRGIKQKKNMPLTV